MEQHSFKIDPSLDADLKAALMVQPQADRIDRLYQATVGQLPNQLTFDEPALTSLNHEVRASLHQSRLADEVVDATVGQLVTPMIWSPFRRWSAVAAILLVGLVVALWSRGQGRDQTSWVAGTVHASDLDEAVVMGSGSPVVLAVFGQPIDAQWTSLSQDVDRDLEAGPIQTADVWEILSVIEDELDASVGMM